MAVKDAIIWYDANTNRWILTVRVLQKLAIPGLKRRIDYSLGLPPA